MIQTKVKTYGGELGLPLPEEVLETLALNEGDEVFLVPSEKGFVLSTQIFTIERQIRAGEEAVTNFPKALKALAQ